MKTTTTDRVAAGGLVAVLVATALFLGFAFLQKSPCIGGDWVGEVVQYSKFCYTDIIPLYGGQGVEQGRLPYFEACPEDRLCDEYPPGTMYTIWLLAQPVDNEDAFFVLNALVLGLCALATSFVLVRLTGRRAFYLAFAPSLIVYAFLNWDLIAILMSVLGIWAFLRGRQVVAGTMIGLGITTKLFPVLFLVGMVLDLVRKRSWSSAVNLAGSAVVTWYVTNMPFIFFARDGWLRFFRFNTERYLNFESTWAALCDHVLPRCTYSGVNLASAIAFVIGALVVVALALSDRRGQLWTLGLPLFVVFLLTNKVYSPQYSLWLAPWFALTLPSLLLFVLFSLADLAVFFTIFSHFGTFQGLAGFTINAVHIAVTLRVAALLAILVVYFVRRRRGRLDAPVPP